MTIYYDPKITDNLVGIYMTNINGFGFSDSSDPISTPRAMAVTIYGGTQPDASAFVSNWASTYYNTYLVRWTSPVWTRGNATTTTQSNTWQLQTPPAVATAINTGTATWGVLWCQNFGTPTTTFPNPAGFLLGPVGIIGSNTVFRLASTSITSGASVGLPDASFTFTVPALV